MNEYLKKLKEHKVQIIVKGPFLNLFITNVYRFHINISHIEYIDKETLSCIISKNNLKVLKREFKDYKIIIKKEEGIYRLKPFLIKNKIFFTTILFGLVIFVFLKNVIIKVEVIHSDKQIREFVTDELEQRGIKRLTLKKSYKELQKIKQEILEKYPNKLEWIEIENIGMTYKIRIEQRIITDIPKSDDYCHIIASKSTILTKVNSTAGMNLKMPGDYVEKGDIIISGDITYNEELKNSLCAQGEAYGEVWYKASVKVPLNYQEKIKTGKSRINFMYETEKDKHTILKSRFDNKVVENKKLFSLLGVTIYYQKEYEVKVENKKYTKEEALDRALELAAEKINLKLDEKEHIIAQKVLNNKLKDSTMYVDVFTSVEENIGVVEHYTPQNNTEESGN